MPMTPTQCRAARSLLGWSLDRLKEETASSGDEVARVTIVNFENGRSVRDDRVRSMRQTLESAGIVFIGDGEVSRTGGAGVRFEQQREE